MSSKVTIESILDFINDMIIENGSKDFLIHWQNNEKEKIEKMLKNAGVVSVEQKKSKKSKKKEDK